MIQHSRGKCCKKSGLYFVFRATLATWGRGLQGFFTVVETRLLVVFNLRIYERARRPSLVGTSQCSPCRRYLKSSDASQWKGILRAPVAALYRDEAFAIAGSFSFGIWSAVDAFYFRKNLCASQQEFELLRTVGLYFPSLQAYPNQPLCNFIDVEKLGAMVPLRVRNYAGSAQVDVLLCTSEEDLVVGIELDSVHHDSEEAAERDELKNQLFKLAGLPLVRIRAAGTKAVRAEDFYDLMMAESQTLDMLRPRRLRPRRTHDFLVPAEAVSR